MITGIRADILHGYTGYDHLIDTSDELAATSAVAGVEFCRSADALSAAKKAFVASCDCRVRTARVQVTLRTARGAVVTVG